MLSVVQTLQAGNLIMVSTNMREAYGYRVPAKWRGTGGRKGYGRWEKKGREEGSLRWREAREKFKKAVKETNPTTFLHFHLTFSEA